MKQAMATVIPDSAAAPGHAPAVARVVGEICGMAWQRLDADELLHVARAYYYFSIQFRENLEIACRQHPDDGLLRRLYAEECHTDNLSPWPGIAGVGERLDHDEFMRRLLALQPVAGTPHLDLAGRRYLARVRRMPDAARARSIASYEDGGLSSVFGAMLRMPDWRGRAQQAFRFFLEQHIKFDTDESGHGALSRHLAPDDSILPLWTAFRDILALAAPRLCGSDTKRRPRRLAYLQPVPSL